jgi:uncharacterized glyoxalase superfamily protein PhnB
MNQPIHPPSAHKPPPAGWPQMASCLFYREPAAAIDWLCEAFGFEIRLKVEGEPGEIVHSELMYGSAMIMVGGTAQPDQDDYSGKEFKLRHASPLDLGGRLNQSICLFVDDVEAHCVQARAHGATIYAEPATQDYGAEYWSDRGYGAYDREGHAWWFMQRLREQPAR